MTRKEEILYAALALASEHGAQAVSMSQIAQRVGIRKASLYSHFASKDEIFAAMYELLRERAAGQPHAVRDYGALFEGRTLEEILLTCFAEYAHFLRDPDMLCFFRVLYTQRSISPAAAQILLEESQRMIAATRDLFYALVVHGRMRGEDTDTAALSYAMTVHGLVDQQMDRMTAGVPEAPGDGELPAQIKDYIRWFSKQMEVVSHA
ncbi:MAG: TetR/AcrR family transcriptional regulator [Oscillospiraceae bacterium]|nr:TetR/AcrR family transcriptional regulator [Oscillospiraceae bacterium]